ncbi:hypothetical protein OYC64_016228 [Pagothenia borchgrevinki]|uniref:Uncharacterized protein n=1 Tax=Pagothenia borchgrevinki TaxID=8213 RepID=A0ABD2HKE4_PAGBO
MGYAVRGSSGLSAAALSASQLPVYLCPLVLHDEGSEDANIIAKIPLYAKLSPVLCSLRRVRLVSLL